MVRESYIKCSKCGTESAIPKGPIHMVIHDDVKCHVCNHVILKRPTEAELHRKPVGEAPVDNDGKPWGFITG